MLESVPNSSISDGNVTVAERVGVTIFCLPTNLKTTQHENECTGQCQFNAHTVKAHVKRLISTT